MPNDEILRRVMRYYRPAVLAVFHSQADKYTIHTDEFEGKVRVRSSHYALHEGTDNQSYLNVGFGFRACKNGEWAVAAWGPDLNRASADEQQLWSGFQLDDDSLTPADDDTRFTKWVRRYIDGSWDVEPGPIAGLATVVGELNSITECVVSAPLFSSKEIGGLCFPLAENNHRYHDAHAEVYKLIIDGLNREAIKRLGDKLGISVNPEGKWTKKALGLLLLDAVRPAVIDPLEKVSKQRRLAGHQERPEPRSFPAFEEFGKDMRALVAGLEALRDDLAERLNVDVVSCQDRASSLRELPDFDETRLLEPSDSISKVLGAVGKQVFRVRAGYRAPKCGEHDTEALILEFSDASMLGIDSATNIGQLIPDGAPIEPESLDVWIVATDVPSSASCEFRASALEHLPTLDEGRPPEPHYAICRAFSIEGKVVVRVRAGHIMRQERRCGSQALILEFSDGSMLGIEPVTNIAQVVRELSPIEAKELHVTFWVTYVPPVLPHRRAHHPSRQEHDCLDVPLT